MDVIKLGTLVKIQTGKLDANASSPDGKYPFFTCSKEVLRIDKYRYDCECVLVAGNGDLNVKYFDGKFNAYQRTYIIESLDKTLLHTKFLYYFMENYVVSLREQSIGGVIKYIKLGNLTDARIPLPTIETQKKIAAVLDKAQELIDKRKEQIERLDEFIQSVFIDMFGDPVINPKEWKKNTINSFAQVRIGPFGTLLHKEDYIANGHPLINPSHIVNSEINPDCMLTITREKYAELASYHLEEGDIVLGRRGEIGRCAIVKDNKLGLICGTGSMFIRVHNLCNPLFLQHQISKTSLRKTLEGEAKGITMKNLNSSNVEKLKTILPPIAIQNKFVEIVKKTEQQKALLEKSLTEMENNFNSIMQRAFKGELF